MFAKLSFHASLLALMLLSHACGPSPKEICTNLSEKFICAFESYQRNTSANNDPIEQMQAQGALLAVQAAKGPITNGCVEGYEKKGKECQDALSGLEKCLAKLNCNAGQTFPCQFELALVISRNCIDGIPDVTNLSALPLPKTWPLR